jgi:hypothetical protein
MDENNTIKYNKISFQPNINQFLSFHLTNKNHLKQNNTSNSPTFQIIIQ